MTDTLHPAGQNGGDITVLSQKRVLAYFHNQNDDFDSYC